MKQFISALLIALAIPSFAADQAVQQEPYIPRVGLACSNEGGFTRWMTEEPLFCKNGVWSDVSFEDLILDDRGGATLGSYGGECTYRYKLGDDKTARVKVNAGDVLDICLPEGWSFAVVAPQAKYQWQMTLPKLIPNLALMRAPMQSGTTRMLIYPVSPTGVALNKIELFAQVVDQK